MHINIIVCTKLSDSIHKPSKKHPIFADEVLLARLLVLLEPALNPVLLVDRQAGLDQFYTLLVYLGMYGVK
jgi:hypothetical protein